MTTEKVNATLQSGDSLYHIGGELLFSFGEDNAEVWGFKDDDFVALVRNGVLVENDWYSTKADAILTLTKSLLLS